MARRVSRVAGSSSTMSSRCPFMSPPSRWTDGSRPHPVAIHALDADGYLFVVALIPHSGRKCLADREGSCSHEHPTRRGKILDGPRAIGLCGLGSVTLRIAEDPRRVQGSKETRENTLIPQMPTTSIAAHA